MNPEHESSLRELEKYKVKITVEPTRFLVTIEFNSYCSMLDFNFIHSFTPEGIRDYVGEDIRRQDYRCTIPSIKAQNEAYLRKCLNE